MVTVWRTVLLLSCYDCDSTHQHYDVTRVEYVLWRRIMHEWVMNIHYQTWIAQGRFINIIRTPSKQWCMWESHCSDVCNIMLYWTTLKLQSTVHVQVCCSLALNHWDTDNMQCRWSYLILELITTTVVFQHWGMIENEDYFFILSQKKKKKKFLQSWVNTHLKSIHRDVVDTMYVTIELETVDWVAAVLGPLSDVGCQDEHTVVQLSSSSVVPGCGSIVVYTGKVSWTGNRNTVPFIHPSPVKSLI